MIKEKKIAETVTESHPDRPFYKRKSFWTVIASVGCLIAGGPIPACLSLSL